MQNDSKNKIIKLENNKEYFVIESINDGDINYILLLNLIDQNEIKISKKIFENGQDYILDVNDLKDISNLKLRFKEQLDKDRIKLLEN